MQNLTCNASECSESRERPVVVWILWLIFFTTRESLSSSQALIDKQLERKKDYSNFYDNLLDGGGGWGGGFINGGEERRLITYLPATQYPNVRVIMKYRLVSFLTKSVLERHLVLWISRTICILSVGEPRTKTNKGYKFYCMLKRYLAQIYLVRRVRRSAYQRGKGANHRVIRKGAYWRESNSFERIWSDIVQEFNYLNSSKYF